MKRINLIQCLMITMLMLENAGCKKESIDLRAGNPNTPVIPIQENTAPVANAGRDRFVWSPLFEAELLGSYLDAEKDVNDVSWAKISGPNSYTLENKDSLTARISGLETGDYQFELTVTDKLNLYNKDTMVVSVGEMPLDPNEFIFKDQVWIPSWSNDIEIIDFVSNIPPGSMFKIFIQRDNDPDWKEVPRGTSSWPVDGYDYFIPTISNGVFDNRNLYISYYGFDIDDTPDVKIVF